MIKSERMCSVEGCHRQGQHLGRYYAGTTIPYRRDKCAKHHMMEYAIGNWKYKQYRKTYCENIDGRLGFKCTTTIIDPEWQLDADHIDGNPSNNSANNIQTLCKCCHPIKTKISKDYATAGRKALAFA